MTGARDGLEVIVVNDGGELSPGPEAERFVDRLDLVVVEQAHAPSILRSAARGVTVRGLVVEKAANEAQRAAIDNEGGGGWAIEDNEVRYNHGVGIRGDSSTVRGNVVHHNGQLGLSGHGDGSLVEGNEIAWNNTAGYQCLWECGGTKWAETRGLVVRGNWSHDNHGPGMWTDINNVDVLYEDNVVTGNQGYGILHEISYRATIRGNVVEDTRPATTPASSAAARSSSRHRPTWRSTATRCAEPSASASSSSGGSTSPAPSAPTRPATCTSTTTR